MDFNLSPWYEVIDEYLKNGTIIRGIDRNKNKNGRIRIKKHAIKYIVIGNKFYRISFEGILLRCVHYREIETTWK